MPMLRYDAVDVSSRTEPRTRSQLCHLAWREYGTDGLTVQTLMESWPLPFHDFTPVRALSSIQGPEEFHWPALVFNAVRRLHELGYDVTLSMREASWPTLFSYQHVAVRR